MWHISVFGVFMYILGGITVLVTKVSFFLMKGPPERAPELYLKNSHSNKTYMMIILLYSDEFYSGVS